MRSTIAILAVLALQTPTQEVRIRSAVYTPQPPTISVQTNLVELGATVRDNHGKFASGLQASDFEVLDKGVPQAIKFFAEQRTAPGPGIHRTPRRVLHLPLRRSAHRRARSRFSSTTRIWKATRFKDPSKPRRS